MPRSKTRRIRPLRPVVLSLESRCLLTGGPGDWNPLTPIAIDDYAVTIANASVTVDALVNDGPGGGKTIDLASLGRPSHGTARLVRPQDPTYNPAVGRSYVVYTPAYGYTGPDKFDYFIANDLGLTDWAWITVDVRGATTQVADGGGTGGGGGPSPGGGGSTSSGGGSTGGGTTSGGGGGTSTGGGGSSNHPPVAYPDLASIYYRNATIIDVIHGNSVNWSGRDTDPDNDPLTLASVTNGQHGTTTIASNAVLYTPDSKFVGRDEFRYTISDGKGGQASASVTVEVAFKLDVQASRTGGYFGQPVAAYLKRNHDPADYVILTNNNDDENLAGGMPDYSDDQILWGHEDPDEGDGWIQDEFDPALFKIATPPLNPFSTAPQPQVYGHLEIAVSNPESAAIYKGYYGTGGLLYKPGVTGASALTAGLSPGQYVLEGLKADEDFTLTVSWVDDGFTVAQDEIHMTIADFTFRDFDGNQITEVDSTWKDSLLAAAEAVEATNASLPSSSQVEDPILANPGRNLYRAQIDGLTSLLGVSLRFWDPRGFDPETTDDGDGVGDSYIDDLEEISTGLRSRNLAALLSSGDILYAQPDGPTTSEEHAFVLNTLGVNMILAPQGQASLKTKHDVQKRKLSVPGEYVIELEDNDGVYRVGDHIRGTIISGNQRPHIYAWIGHLDNDGKEVITEIAHGEETPSVSFDIIVATPGPWRIFGGIVEKQQSQTVPVQKPTTLYIAKNAATILVIGATEHWSEWRSQAWLALRPQGVGTPGPGINRNRAITKNYADFFSLDKDCEFNRFEWAGMAAFASKSAGDGMAYASDLISTKALVSAIGGPDLLKVKHLLYEGNLAIYMDMYPQMLAYKSGGIAEIYAMFARDEISQDQRDAWVLIDDGIRLGDETKIWAGNSLLANVEQRVTIQKIYADLDLWQRVTDAKPTSWWKPIDSPYPGYTDTFQEFRVKDSDVPDDASLADANARMHWFTKKILPAWKTWRLTHNKIDFDMLIQGKYK